jgi:hypothetical protein
MSVSCGVLTLIGQLAGRLDVSASGEQRGISSPFSLLSRDISSIVVVIVQALLL